MRFHHRADLTPRPSDQAGNGLRSKPAAVVEESLHGGGLNLIEDWLGQAELPAGAFKFTVTSPYMLARTLLDNHYGDFESLTMAIAEVLADQVKGLPCSCLQVDEAKAFLAVRNTVRLPPRPSTASLMPSRVRPGFIFCFGNYGRQTIQAGKWKP